MGDSISHLAPLYFILGIPALWKGSCHSGISLWEPASLLLLAGAKAPPHLLFGPPFSSPLLSPPTSLGTGL
jgi:hypothetical protein